MKACIHESTLRDGYRQAVLWQQNEEIPEPAIIVRTYEGGLISIVQGKSEILINVESISDLVTVLRGMAARPKDL